MLLWQFENIFTTIKQHWICCANYNATKWSYLSIVQCFSRTKCTSWTGDVLSLKYIRKSCVLVGWHWQSSGSSKIAIQYTFIGHLMYAKIREIQIYSLSYDHYKLVQSLSTLTLAFGVTPRWWLPISLRSRLYFCVNSFEVGVSIDICFMRYFAGSRADGPRLPSVGHNL